MPRIAVLGGGVSGLALAYALQKEAEVVVFEQRDRVGGNIRSEIFEGCLVEWGPNGFLDNEPATLHLVAELGLTDRVQQARKGAARRFVWRRGKLRGLPESPGKFLTSDCLSLGARLRVLFEPWAKGAPPGDDESVRAFAARRIGKGAADVLVDAFVTGIFAGDPSRLSVASAFPRLRAVEAEHGSLIKGFKAKKRAGPSGTLTSFEGGMEVLIRALAEWLDVRLEAQVQKLDPGEFDQVICTVPATRAAALVDDELAVLLRQIPTAPVAVVATIFREPLDVPDAFGFLAPHNQGLRILGTLYDSSIFPGRAPDGFRLFRTMVGGRRDPDAVALSDDELLHIVAEDLRRVWGVWPEPHAVRVIRHPVGIPQYEIGHGALLERIDAARPPWLYLTGSSYRGVSVNACVKEALDWTP
ncbi:MAG: protoporphyrinogen oxidase [Planctomycetota bacterium]|nr:protoporphyrinogen oxidase [Planctomycetota bacterium]